MTSALGITSTSFMGSMLGKRSSRSVLSLPPAPYGDTVQFLERCSALGAAGVQSQICGDPHTIRTRAEELGMWVEAMVSVRNSTPEELERSIIVTKEAGCTLARDGLLGGRRYETFDTIADWNAWVAESVAKLEAAIPIFEKHKFTLALENHKDWTANEYVDLFKKYDSEYFGACLDFGNNISLLDDWLETIEMVAPYVKATHLKDVGLTPYQDGFLLAELPLGAGVLDLTKAISIVRKSSPKVRFSLEMITRDPLPVPCLTDRYWITFPERSGLYLARTIRFVNEHKSITLPLPEELPGEEHAKVEEENIRACMRWGQRLMTDVATANLF